MPTCSKCGNVFADETFLKVQHEPRCTGTGRYGPAPTENVDGTAPIAKLLLASQSLLLTTQGHEDPRHLMKSMDRVNPTYRKIVQDLNLKKTARCMIASLSLGSANKATGQFRQTVCSEDTVKRLVCAMDKCHDEGLFEGSCAQRIQIIQFMLLPERDQLAIVDAIWNEATIQKAYNCKAAEMCEVNPKIVSNSMGQLPSSIHPAPKGSGPEFMKGKRDLPFKTLGIAFRTELGNTPDYTTREDDTINRIKSIGFTTQAINAALMLRKGLKVDLTTIARDTSAPRFNRAKMDIFNETAVCVSRSLFGATALPERGTKTPCLLFAVDCSGLTGFDTEEFQKSQKDSSPWRPGEKAFQEIPFTKVIGYVRLNRKGGDYGENWKFMIDPGAKWTYLNDPGGEKKAYCEEELAAWATGTEYTISGSYDFAS